MPKEVSDAEAAQFLVSAHTSHLVCLDGVLAMRAPLSCQCSAEPLHACVQVNPVTAYGCGLPAALQGLRLPHKQHNARLCSRQLADPSCWIIATSEWGTRVACSRGGALCQERSAHFTRQAQVAGGLQTTRGRAPATVGCNLVGKVTLLQTASAGSWRTSRSPRASTCSATRPTACSGASSSRWPGGVARSSSTWCAGASSSTSSSSWGALHRLAPDRTKIFSVAGKCHQHRRTAGTSCKSCAAALF